MSRYIKKHREHFTWVIIPLFCLVLLGTLSFSVFPGWIRPAFSTLGAPCDDISSDASNPLIAACDSCKDEFCSFANQTAGTGTCSQGFFNQSFPQCQCVSTLMSINFGPAPAFFFVPTFGGPDDGFCADISGGQTDNNCRDATCTTNTNYDPTNPTGCDFEFNPDLQLCTNCLPTGTDSCGNGICDQDLGEDFNDCEVDCMTPGFQFDTVLTENDPILNAACNTGAGAGISYAGNIQGSGACEDGDVCTTNTCQGGNPPAASKLGTLTGFCDIEPAGCSGNTSDLCCPTGCDPAPNGVGTCNSALDPSCDVDCLEDCPGGVIPGGPVEISGDGILSCSVSASSGGGKSALLALGLGLGLLAALRRREAR